MDEIDLEKETYKNVVSHIQAGNKAQALEVILPEANDDSTLANSILAAIERSLNQTSESSRTSEKEEFRPSATSPEEEPPPTTSILLPTVSKPIPKRKSTLLGDHTGITDLELEKAAFLEVVDLMKAGKRDLAFDLIFFEANQNSTLAAQVIDAIADSLLEEAMAEPNPSPAIRPASPAYPAYPFGKKAKPKKLGKQGPGPGFPEKKPPSTKSELDPADQEKRKARRTTVLVSLLGGILGYLFYRSGMRPRKAILVNLALCLIAGLTAGYFLGYISLSPPSERKLPGSDPGDQETLNYVAVALCPLLTYDLDLHAGQRNFCSRKRNRFAYFLYEESRKIDGLDTIQGPFTEETLQAGLYNLGKEIKGQLNRSQRKQFLELYKIGQLAPVDIVDDNGRFRLEYPDYGNAPGVIPLSVASGN